MKRWVALVVLLAVAVGACAGSADRVVIAAGTTVVDSGFMQAVVDGFHEAGGDGEFAVVGVASAEALSLLDGGAAQLAVTHAPILEEAYLADHPQTRARAVFTSRFVIVGPPGQSIVAPDSDPLDAFATIAAAEATFVSRGDGSGTHGRELELWSLAGLEPFEAPWYIETGQGMGFTLQVADQRGGFALAEDGAYLAASENLTLSPLLVRDDRLLDNPYRTILDDAAPAAAHRFADWLASPEGAAVVRSANERLFGTVVYRPAT